MPKKPRTHIDRLMCGNPVSLTYDFVRHRGVLVMEEMCCCDKSGCIALFEAIDPGVKYIQTTSDGRKDTAFRWAHGNWDAITAPFIS